MDAHPAIQSMPVIPDIRAIAGLNFQRYSIQMKRHQTPIHLAPRPCWRKSMPDPFLSHADALLHSAALACQYETVMH